MNRFYLGTHMVNWLWNERFAGCPLFVSVLRIMRYRNLRPAVTPWALDSAGFSMVTTHGYYTIGPRQYVAIVRRCADEIGNLEWAATQDWMCEEIALAKSRRTVAEHQQLTVNSWIALNSMDASLPWAPVIQGYTRDDYLRCIDLYDRHTATDLRKLPVVGVGSICRRQGIAESREILLAIRAAGFHNIHAFGLKINGLRLSQDIISSADSMAWSYDARRKPKLPDCTHGNCANCPEFASIWLAKLLHG